MSRFEPISCGSEYRCITDFEKALVEWETKFGHEFRVGSSENLKNKYGMKDEVFEYRVLVLQCVHFGNIRDREYNPLDYPTRRESAALVPTFLAAALLRLNFSVKEQLLRITSLIDVHTGHELQPGELVGRKRLSERRKSLKRARMSDATGIPVVVQDLDFGIKPKIPFPMISALAIYNSPNGKLLTKEIYLFFETYFPFFRTAYGSWKNSVRHALHTHVYFEKTMGQNKDKENLVFSISALEKFTQDVDAFAAKFPDRSMKIYGLSDPDHWDVMVKGELKNNAVAIHRPKAIFPKRIKKELEAEEDDMEPFVIIDSPQKMAANDNSVVDSPSTSAAAHLSIPFDDKVSLIGDVMPQNPCLPQQPLNMQCPLLQDQFNPMQYALQGSVLQFPGVNDYSGLHALAQAASAINYNDIRLL